MTRDVHWLTCDRGELPASLDWLAPDERIRLAAMRIAKRRDDFALGRWTAKRALAAWLPGAPPAAIEIRAAADGAPEAFLDGARLPFAISISHSADRALAAVGGAAPLGADIERIEPRSPLLVDDYFTADEAAHVAACPPGDRDRTITAIWSAKESALKARRTGLREDPRRMRVALGRAALRAAWHPLDVSVDGEPPLPGWWRDRDGYLITVVGHGLADPPRSCLVERTLMPSSA